MVFQGARAIFSIGASRGVKEVNLTDASPDQSGTGATALIVPMDQSASGARVVAPGTGPISIPHQLNVLHRSSTWRGIF